MPHPEEVPIAEFSASPISKDVPESSAASIDPAKPELKGETKPTETKVDVKKPEAKEGIDGIDGAFGVKLGGPAKSSGKTKSVEKVGDRVVLQALDRRKDFGVTVAPVFGLFKDHVGTVGFRVKVPKECKGLRGTIEKRFGAPTAAVKGKPDSESAVWKGESVGIRLAIDAKGCSGLLVHREFSRDQDWGSLEP